ncbi:MAG: hypothetical protein CL916_06145, partial [Deltaproteobacteria bacterium]|nr:hypothetical protein [Deltaproteobacteria bacterium]
KDEANMWFDEAAQFVQNDAFDFLLLLEAHTAMFGVPSSESFVEMREMGLLYSLKEQLMLLEDLEARLGVLDEEWIARCQYEDTKERILWCSSRYATQEEREALNKYTKVIQEQLLTFSLVYEEVDWNNLEECEGILSDQIRWLARIHQRNKIYDKEGFAVPVLNPPFSHEQDRKHQSQLEELFEQRRLDREAHRKREQKRQERQDGYAVLIIVALACGLLWLLF